MSFWKKLFGLRDKSESTGQSLSLNQGFDEEDANNPKSKKPETKLIKPTKKSRKDYEASCLYLQSTGHLGTGDIPPYPKSIPRFDDEELGFSFFRELCEGKDFSNLTLSRTFFGKSELNNCSFLNTDLSESVLCWNDFIRVDFSHADLSNADLRASDFEQALFKNAILSKADLRLSDYGGCDFEDAIMTDSILSKDMRNDLKLSDKQIAEIDWRDECGDEPDGG